MARRFIFSLMVLFFTPLFLYAATTVTSLQVEGIGLTRNEAIQNALIEALKQTKGVSIASRKAFSKKIRQVSVSADGANAHSVDIHGSSSSNIQEATKGLIDSYRILRSTKTDSREWEVTLLVKILNYKSPGLSTKNRRKVAVMPFHYTKNYFQFGNENISGKQLAKKLNQALTNVITQARRFAVVDLNYAHDMQQELNRIASPQTPLSEKVKLGQRLAADYLIVGTIEDAKMQTRNTTNRLLGTTSYTKEAEFIVHFRVIAVGTSQVKWSDTQKMAFEIPKSYNSNEMALSNSVDQLAHAIVNKILSNIYPIRVVDITSGNVILNQGGNTLSVGTQLDVMKLGKRLIDPYTKEPLGQVETKVATIEITNVTAKLSYAKVISGSLEDIKANEICRRTNHNSNNTTQSSNSNNANWKKSSVKVEQGGGVRLPFD